MSVDPSFRCRSCGAAVDAVVVDLGEQPPSDVFPLVDDARGAARDPRWLLQARVCERCWLVQLTPVSGVLEQEPLAVESATSQQLARTSVHAVLERTGLPAGATFTELMSHHGGSWSDALHQRGLAEAAGGASADLVVDVHALAHEEDIARALAAHAGRIASTGWLALEFHHLLPLMEEGQFDTIRHGHPVYLSVLALRDALERHGLVAIDATSSTAFGGSVVLIACPADAGREPTGSLLRLIDAERAGGLAEVTSMQRLQDRARSSAEALHGYLAEARREGRRVLGYGAPSKAPIRLGLAGIGPDLLAMTADISAAKHGRRLPGCGIPICSPEELLAAQPDEILILTWDIADEVVQQLRNAGATARFSVPAPYPQVIG